MGMLEEAEADEQKSRAAALAARDVLIAEAQAKWSEWAHETVNEVVTKQWKVTDAVADTISTLRQQIENEIADAGKVLPRVYSEALAVDALDNMRDGFNPQALLRNANEQVTERIQRILGSKGYDVVSTFADPQLVTHETSQSFRSAVAKVSLAKQASARARVEEGQARAAALWNGTE